MPIMHSVQEPVYHSLKKKEKKNSTQEPVYHPLKKTKKRRQTVYRSQFIIFWKKNTKKTKKDSPHTCQVEREGDGKKPDPSLIGVKDLGSQYNFLDGHANPPLCYLHFV